MSAALYERALQTRAAGGRVPARRAVLRWAWRLFRREWRQQILLVALIAVAVAATTFGAAVADNAPSSAVAATFGTADKVLTLPGHDPHLAADIASVERRFGAADVIENQTIAVPGSVSSADLRAQNPHGRYGQPMLSLVSGHYPTGPDEIAVTRGVASLLDLRIGDVWQQAGHARRVTGLVENPASLLDEFALVSPGQVGAPTKVTVLFDASAASVGGLHFPGGATPKNRASADKGISPATSVLVVAVLGLIFIGLVAVAGFTVVAQRRLRSLGMLGALGATDRNIRLVMVAGGALVGVVGTSIGAAVGFLAWIAYAPRLQASVEHRVDWSHLPWWAIATAMALAIVTAVAAAWQPARSAARIPVVAALSGRPAPPKASHRAALAGIVVLAAGLGCLASAGGWPGLLDRRIAVPSVLAPGGGWAVAWTSGHAGGTTLLLVVGIVATAVGALLLAPLAVAGPAVAVRRTPIAVRLALRELGRYRARSGAVLAAISFAVLLAMLVCIIATARSSDPLVPAGPNLAANQLIAYEPHGPGSGYTSIGPRLTAAALHGLRAGVNALAASLHAQFVLPLYSAGRADPAPNAVTFGTNQRATLWRTGGPGSGGYQQSEGPLYVATPALLHEYGIKPSQIEPDTDILTSRAGLAAVPRLELIGQGNIVSRYTPSGQGVSEIFHCPPASCVARPKIQTFTSLPTGTSAPNTVITEQAARALGQRLVPDGWLIQTAGPLTPARINAARQLALGAETRIETSSGAPRLSQIRTWATATGIILALAVMAMTLGLIRSETASDLRTLTAAGAGSTTRRTLAAATAGALGLLGALLGTAVAYLAVIAWAHSDLGATLSPVPVAGLLAILLGLPVAATVSGWLLGGGEPPAIARQPLE
jgi:putative ABC transport system permease protein